MKLKKFSVYISRKLLDPAIPMISKECNVVLNDKGRPPTRKELLNGGTWKTCNSVYTTRQY